MDTTLFEYEIDGKHPEIDAGKKRQFGGSWKFYWMGWEGNGGAEAPSACSGDHWKPWSPTMSAEEAKHKFESAC